MNDLIVKLEGICKSHHLEHGVVHALKGVSLEIHKGESVAVMGPSGSGKSTLLNMMGCLDQPSAGRYFLNHQDVSLLNDRELSLLRASRIGFVFQSYNLIPQLTVYENLEVPFLYQNTRLADEERRARIIQAIEQVGLGHRIGHRPSQLSGGEAQRAAIARALAINPLLLLADEPTGNLDRETGRSILELFEDLHAQGATLVVVTHDESAGSYCERMIWIEDGYLIHDELNKRGGPC